MKRTILWRLAPILLLLFVLGLARSAGAQAEGRIETPRGVFTTLSEALEMAADGDTLEVYGGHYQGAFLVERSVKLIGHDWPVVDGGGEGTVITVVAPDVTISGFVIRNSGDSLDQENSGVAVEAPGAILENNRLQETLFGFYLREAGESVIRNNVITSKDLPVPRRGDAVRVWASHGVLVENNHMSRGRDVVLWYSENLTVRDNQVSDGRYGLHFMYCDDATIENNLLLGNSVGTFLMYSRRLHLIGNTIAYNRGPSGYGIGLKDMDNAVIEGNLFLDNRIGAHLDNSPREVDAIGQFEGNVFAFNDIGVNLMPSVRHNTFVANSFVDNEQQVSIAGGGGQASDNSWSAGEFGNYWSDYVGYDADADGLGDVPYKSERLFENLLDQNPPLRLFMYSPVEQAVDFAARAIPFVRPKPKMADELPLMKPVMPTGLPEIPDRQAVPMWAVSLGLVILAILLLQLGSVERAPMAALTPNILQKVPSFIREFGERA
jgi:nitrous oxidase accessory protein